MAQASKSSFVDLYTFLGLTPEAGTADIQSALKKCAQAAKAAKDPAEAKRIAKLFELGRANLLDAKRKRVYDKKWEVECGKEPFAEEMDWDWSMLEGVLPEGDPTADFDMADFLEHSADLPEVNPQGDYLKLQSLLTGGPITVKAVAETEEEGFGEPAVPTIPPVTGSAPPPPPATYKGSSSPKNKSLAKSIRKKRNQSTYLMIAAMLGSVGAIVGLLAFLLHYNNEDKPAETTTIIVTKAESPRGKTKGENEEPVKPRRSGLPEVGGMGNDPNEGGNTKSPMGEGSNMGQEPKPVQSQEPKPDPGMEPMTPDPEPEPEPELPAVVLTDTEKADWKDWMLDVREFAGQQEYGQAETELVKLEKAAKSKAQQDQLIRLKTAVDLAKTCQQAMLDAMSKLGPGSTFQVKSNEISFVEGSPQRLVVRIGGENKRYQLTEIPIGIVEGLVDLELDVVNQRARAARAAFILFHPKSNALTLPRARRILEEAERDGSVPAGTSLIFEDDYELE
ncbi:MAG: hypothetical protein VXZ82_12660 [Planctomycetota bacterium]|nr:hypothetical protein [Planctomycetota bacterium]